MRDAVQGRITAGGLGLVLALACAPAQARRHHHPRPHAGAALARRNAPLSHQVVIADQLVMVIDTATPPLTPARRVDKINERLIDIIASEPLLPGRMYLARHNGVTTIMVGKHLLTDVTPADARANGTTVPVLAHFWLANLKRALPQARPAARTP